MLVSAGVPVVSRPEHLGPQPVAINKELPKYLYYHITGFFRGGRQTRTFACLRYFLVKCIAGARASRLAK